MTSSGCFGDAGTGIRPALPLALNVNFRLTRGRGGAEGEGKYITRSLPVSPSPSKIMMQGTFHVAESHHLHHSASPDPFTRFLDRSSIYYDPTPTPSSSSPTLRPIDLAGFRSVAAHCDWSDSLPFLPLHYDYPNPSTDNLKPAPPPFSMTSPMPVPLQDSYHSPSLTGTVVSAATSSDITQSIRNACANNSRGASRTSKHEGSGPRPREKKHACWMCEKSFDRPSTLRKVRIPPSYKPDAHPHRSPQHLLVHTGEKGLSILSSHHLILTSLSVRV